MLLAALVSNGKQTNVSEDDAKTLQGVWTVFRARRDGEIDAELAGATVVIADDTFMSKSGEKVSAQGTWKIDAGKKPKSIDIEYTDGPEKGQTVRGIYSVNDGIWSLVLSPAGQDRPVSFKPSSYIGYTLLILKVAKP